MTRWIHRFAALALVTALLGCSHGSSSSGTTGTAPSQAGESGSGSAPIGPQIQPSDQTFDVTWNPQTKVVDATTVKQSYRGVAQDGALTFDAASAPAIAALQPGTVVVFSGLAVRKVTSVQTIAGQLHVATAPVALDEAIQNGHIAWKAPIQFSQLAYQAPRGFHRVDVAADPKNWLERLIADPALAGSGIHYKGEIKGWEIDLTLTPEANDLSIDLDAEKSAAGGGKVTLTGKGELDNLVNSVNITIADGATTQITFDNSNLKGSFDMQWNVAFDKNNGGVELANWKQGDVIKLPLGFDYPFLVGPLPFDFSVGSGFAFAPVFSSETTVAQGEYHASFGGDMEMQDATSESGDTSTTLTGDGTINSYGGTLSLAPMGLSTTLMAPKIELKLGAPEALEAVLGEQGGGPWAAFFIQANFIATGPVSIAACERRELNLIGSVGYEVGLLGHKLADKRWNIFGRHYQLIEPPNITLCQPH